MTPTQLHELVRDVPEVVPAELMFVETYGTWVYDGDRSSTISPLHAADMICGNIRRLLPYMTVQHKWVAEGVVYWQATALKLPDWFVANTELEAVLAAYKSEKGAVYGRGCIEAELPRLREKNREANERIAK